MISRDFFSKIMSPKGTFPRNRINSYVVYLLVFGNYIFHSVQYCKCSCIISGLGKEGGGGWGGGGGGVRVQFHFEKIYSILGYIIILWESWWVRNLVIGWPSLKIAGFTTEENYCDEMQCGGGSKNVSRNSDILGILCNRYPLPTLCGIIP